MRQRMKAGLLTAAILAGAAASALTGAPALAQAQAKEQFFPVLVYRTGAYAPNGVPFANGYVDYLKLVNARDGGINGIKITFEECETGYATDRGVECYERLKGKGPTGATAFHTMSTGITFAVTDKTFADKIPIITAGYGRADSVDGTVFGWNFPLGGTYWDAADMLIQHIGKKEDIGEVLYNRGLTSAMMTVEAVKRAQIKYGKKPLKGEEVRWGLENLAIDNAAIKKLGFEGFMTPVSTSCVDHEGAHLASLHTWDGKRWVKSPGTYEADSQIIKPMIRASAEKYATEKKLTKRDCAKEAL